MKKYRWFQWIAAIFVVLAVVNPFFIAWIFGNKPDYGTFKEFGPIGDWIGGSSTPVIALATFIIVLAAFLAQKEELAEVRLEMKNTRETISRQRFENTFFQMISLHNQISSEFRMTHLFDTGEIDSETMMPIREEKEFRGRHAFEIVIKVLGKSYRQSLVKNSASRIAPEDIADKDMKIILEEAYGSFFSSTESQCGHYLRNLYRIYKFLDKQDMDQEDLIEYAGIIKAQLSSYEQVLIFYNGLSSYGREKFLPLMHKYDILDNLNTKLLLDSSHYRLYEASKNDASEEAQRH